MKNTALGPILAVAIALQAFPDVADAKCGWAKKGGDHQRSGFFLAASKAIQGVALRMGRLEGRFYIETQYGTHFKGKSVIVDEETPLILYLESGYEMSLPPHGQSATKKPIIGIATNSKSVRSSHPVSIDDLRKLSTGRVVALRVNFKVEDSPEGVDFKVGKGQGKNIAKHALCLFELTNPE